jgi:hypothetical protein
MGFNLVFKGLRMNDIHIPKLVYEYILKKFRLAKGKMETPETILMEQAGNGLYPAAGDVDVMETMQNKCKTKLVHHSQGKTVKLFLLFAPKSRESNEGQDTG